MLSTISEGGDVEVTNKLPFIRPTIKPAMVVDYNKYKGGGSTSSINSVIIIRLTTMQRSGGRYCFFNLLDMAITNVHKCHKLKYKTSLLDFLNQLFGNVDLQKNRNALNEPSSSGSPISSVEDNVLMNSGKLIVCLYCAQEGR